MSEWSCWSAVETLVVELLLELELELEESSDELLELDDVAVVEVAVAAVAVLAAS